MCKNWKPIGEYVKSLEKVRGYMYFLTEFNVAGDYMKSLGLRETPGYTHLLYHIYQHLKIEDTAIFFIN